MQGTACLLLPCLVVFNGFLQLKQRQTQAGDEKHHLDAGAYTRPLFSSTSALLRGYWVGLVFKAAQVELGSGGVPPLP